MKVIVLGIDGLDYGLVERWNIEEFKQKSYGKHDVTIAIRKGDPIYTPLIWYSFLLGKPSYLYGLTLDYISYKRNKESYGFLAPLYEIRFKLFGRRKIGLRKLLKKIGLYNSSKLLKTNKLVESIPRDVLKDTFVEVARKKGFRVLIKDFPGINDKFYERIRLSFLRYFDASLEVKVTKLNKLMQYAIESLNEVFENIRNYDLILYYTGIIDEAQHMLYRKGRLRMITLLASYYKKLAKNIGLLNRKYSHELKNTAILIVSDHGYDPHEHTHSKYGIWSLNISVHEKPKTILDFKDLILKLLES